MPTDPYMDVETSRELFGRILNHGVDKDLLLQKTGIDYEKLQQSETRFPVRSHLKLWSVADELLAHEAIGLRMGAESDPSQRGIVGLTFLASPDLNVAVRNKIRYTKILADHIDLSYHETEENFVMTYSIFEGFFHHYEIERVFSAFFNWVRIFIEEDIRPAYLSFQYSPPSYEYYYNNLFQCPMNFNQDENCIAFPKSLLACKNYAHNDYLYGILQSRAETMLHNIDLKTDFLDEVRSIIAGRLARGGF